MEFRSTSIFGLLTILISLTWSINANAFVFSGYDPGFIVLNNGDTLKGIVHYEFKGSNPDSVVFILLGDDHSDTYFPDEIRAFSDYNRLFESGNIVDEKGTSQAMIFLQAVVKGTKSLYRNFENRQATYYIPHIDYFEPLVHTHLETNVSGDSRSIENRVFIDQLKVYLDGCQSLNTEIESANYYAESLAKVFKQYYKCIKDSPVIIKTAKRQSHFGFVIGSTFPSIKGSESFTGHLQSSLQYMIGITLDAAANHNYHYEILYTSFRFHSPNVTIAAHEIRLNIMYRLNIRIGKSTLFINPGFMFAPNFGMVNRATDPVTGSISKAIYNMPGSFVGIALGAGYAYKNLWLELRGSKDFSFGDGPDVGYGDPSMQRLNLLVGYRFKKF